MHSFSHFPLETGSVSDRALLDNLYRSVRRYLNARLHGEPLLSEEDVRDLTADVVSSVWLRVDELSHPVRYARRAARNRLIRFLVTKRRRMQLHHDWCEDHRPLEFRRGPEAVPSVLESGPSNERMEVLRRFMTEADGRTRLILHLRHGSKLSWQDIAHLAGVSASSARMRESRFRRRVRQAWKGNQKSMTCS